MDGLQKTACERLEEVLTRLRAGFYGDGDDLDVESLREDLDDVTADM